MQTIFDITAEQIIQVEINGLWRGMFLTIFVWATLGLMRRTNAAPSAFAISWFRHLSEPAFCRS